MTQHIARFIPQVQFPQNSMAFPKSIKWAPLKAHGVSSRGSITYGVAKELAGIIRPLVGQSQHHVRNTQHCHRENSTSQTTTRVGHFFI